MRRARAGVLGLLVACAPPVVPPLEGTGSTTAMEPTGTGSSSSTVSTVGSTGPEVPPSTFGMDGADGPDGDTEAGFVGPVDLACATGPGALAGCALCDVRAQGCIEGFRCVAWAEDGGEAWNGTKCIDTALAPVGVGEACTVALALTSGQDDCIGGSMCWDADPEGFEGVCVPFCGPEAEDPVCPEGTQCMIDGAGVLALCLPVCDPLEPATCPADAACRFFPSSDAGFCIPDQGGQVLSPTIQCGDGDEVCPADEVCISAANYGGCGSPSCCTRWCDLDAPDADAQCAALEPDHVCVAVFDDRPAPAGYERLGVCAVPQP